ncbi:MAG: TetR family transcriptional regulator, partial [Pseudomonadota bacterium]
MKQRLSRDDWLAHALGTLAAEGAPALRADRMAKALGVSRGSFYWHFRDLDDLNAA